MEEEPKRYSRRDVIKLGLGIGFISAATYVTFENIPTTLQPKEEEVPVPSQEDMKILKSVIEQYLDPEANGILFSQVSLGAEHGIFDSRNNFRRKFDSTNSHSQNALTFDTRDTDRGFTMLNFALQITEPDASETMSTLLKFSFDFNRPQNTEFLKRQATKLFLKPPGVTDYEWEKFPLESPFLGEYSEFTDSEGKNWIFGLQTRNKTITRLNRPIGGPSRIEVVVQNPPSNNNSTYFSPAVIT